MMKSVLTALCISLCTLVVYAEATSLPLSATPSKGKLPSGLNVVTSVKGGDVLIELNDGKLKYGVHNIHIKKGDLTFTRPRLTLKVSLEDAKSVTSESPYKVVDFTHDGTPYVVQLIKGEDDLPNVVITKS